MTNQTDGYVPGAGYAPEDLTGPIRETDEIEQLAAPGSIVWESSTTTTRVERTSTTTDTRVEHVARFEVELGTLIDRTARYSVQQFRPDRMTATWADSLLVKVRLVGPRVLKSGLSPHQRKDDTIETNRFMREQSLDRTQLEPAIAAAISDYEAALAASRATEAGWK